MILVARRFIAQCCTLGFFLLFFGCQKEEIVPFSFTGKTMGTTYSIKYIYEKDLGTELQKEVDDRLIEINKAVSTYDPKSEISELNQNNITERKIYLSTDLFVPLEDAFLMAQKTKGVFDPTIGPLVNLWGFGPEGEKKVPTAEEIEVAKARVGYNKIILDPQDFTIVKKIDTKDIYLDLSATAKGYAVDQIATLLDKKNIKDYMVEIGGELRVAGMKGDQPWKIAVETPDPNAMNKSIQKVLNITNVGMATSGNYRNFFEENGKRFSHTIDFHTGKPVEWIMASVTVLHPTSCMKADTWATALMALGPEKAMEVANKFKIAAYFIYNPTGNVEEKFVEKSTQYFEDMINPPTEKEEK